MPLILYTYIYICKIYIFAIYVNEKTFKWCSHICEGFSDFISARIDESSRWMRDKTLMESDDGCRRLRVIAIVIGRCWWRYYCRKLCRVYISITITKTITLQTIRDITSHRWILYAFRKYLHKMDEYNEDQSRPARLDDWNLRNIINLLITIYV